MIVQPTSSASTSPEPRSAADAFLNGRSDRQLLIAHCESCRRLVHPPRDTCAKCGQILASTPVSGAGVVFTYTINHQQFHPDVPPPYVIALIELIEQPGLRLAANIVDCEPESVHIGMRVQARFEQRGQRFVPVFRPSARRS
jgi:uncharacterized OB-fold protein